jgi:glycosyltransferase involved in cell wall biosynthesis
MSVLRQSDASSHKRREARPLRILLAHSFYRIKGGEDYYFRQQAELLSRNHSIELLTLRNDQLLEGFGTAARMLYSRGTVREVSRVIERFRPDVIHAHNVYPSLGPAVHLAAEQARVPLVITIHNYRMRCPNGVMFTEGEPCQRCYRGNHLNALVHECFPSRKQSLAYASTLWLHRFVARLERKVALYVCPSDFVRGRVLDWGIPPDRVIGIPNFVSRRTDANARPGHFGLFVGRLSAEKGVNVLLAALRTAKDPPFRVIGDGPLAATLRGHAATIGLKNTEFMGRLPRDQVDQMLGDARFLALPSLWDENAPLAGLEALASGRPLLVTSRGGLPELVREGNGLTCHPGDPRGMAKGIEKLMDDDEFCIEAGTRSLRLSRKEFAPEKHLARLEAAYRTCIERPPTAWSVSSLR